MSRKPTAHPVKHSSDHGHGHHDGHGHGDDHAPHGTFKSYMTGFVLSVILTAIPFWLVMGKPIDFGSPMALAIVLLVFALVQMVVHMIFFLHMHPKAEGGWSMMALFFTLIVVIITMSGSMWVMYHLNTNMMPAHDMEKMDTTGETWVPSRGISGTVPSVSGTVAE